MDKIHEIDGIPIYAEEHGFCSFYIDFKDIKKPISSNTKTKIIKWCEDNYDLSDAIDRFIYANYEFDPNILSIKDLENIIENCDSGRIVKHAESAKFMYEHRHEIKKIKKSSCVPSKSESMGFLYLAFDEKTECTKIGFSKKPKYRESTLQSEKPFITLFLTIKGSRKDEASLHDRFQEKRLRGEWFWLRDTEINEIIEVYRDREIHKLNDFDRIVNSLKKEED